MATTLTRNPAEWTASDRRAMARALELAKAGVGQVSPGPLVGCVIVDAGGEIAGEGFYIYEDVKHAETLALTRAGSRARGGTAYVSLEPHAHYGRTPPCTDALIEAGIVRVVAPIEDVNPEVSGKGFAHLRAAGVEVETGLLADEAKQLNEKYLHFMGTGRPFVHLKLAVSLDGKIATRTGDSHWVTGDEALRRAQELRHESDAILVGAGTVRIDDPLLTDRSGLRRRRQLVRAILDDNLETAVDSRLVTSAGDSPLVVFASGEPSIDLLQEFKSRGVEVVRTDRCDLLSTLTHLGRNAIQSVLVEGGAGVAGEFIDAGLVDKITFFIAPKIVGSQLATSAIGGKGVESMSDALPLERVEVHQRGSDLEVTGYPRRKADE
jgi:diaminohydroxyphosphoribosylaminopyrimidine deaminase / 5-amino-6-(5-phosphoribosylamino)uracil reductase